MTFGLCCAARSESLFIVPEQCRPHATFSSPGDIGRTPLTETGGEQVLRGEIRAKYQWVVCIDGELAPRGGYTGQRVIALTLVVTQ